MQVATGGEGPAVEEPALAVPDKAKPTHVDEVVRVSVSKLDTLLNLVGELVIHNSGFVALSQQLRDQYGKTPFIYDLEEKTEALSAITRDLQEGIMKARMLPIANVFNRFNRVVRDLSKASRKTVTLEIFGEETEIDKKVIDRIGEPLVHLIRNAVDHGIEPADERAAAGKSREGHDPPGRLPGRGPHLHRGFRRRTRARSGRDPEQGPGERAAHRGRGPAGKHGADPRVHLPARVQHGANASRTSRAAESAWTP